MEILVHINKRIKSRPSVQLPLDDLLANFNNPIASSSFVAVGRLVYSLRLLAYLIGEFCNRRCFFDIHKELQLDLHQIGLSASCRQSQDGHDREAARQFTRQVAATSRLVSFACHLFNIQMTDSIIVLIPLDLFDSV